MFRRIASDSRIDLKVFFLSSLGVGAYRDPGFGIDVTWDVPLLGGYQHEFLSSADAGIRGIAARLRGAFDALWLHDYAQLGNLYALSAARSLGIPVMLRCESHLRSHRRSATRRFAKAVLVRTLFKLVDSFLAIGTANYEYYLHYGVAPARIHMMPYAVDNSFFRLGAERAAANREQLRAVLDLAPHRPVILYASKLLAAKRPHDLLDAYMRMGDDQREPDPYLIFVGDGTERRSLESRVRSSGWSSIRFIGFVGQTELPRYYDLCDVFVLPSEFEPWGLVVNEVMNAGRPLIVSDRVGAARDLVRDGVNGFVVPAGDSEGLSDRLKILLADPSRRERMGAASAAIIDDWSFDADLAGLRQALEACGRVPRTDRAAALLNAAGNVHAL